MDVKQISDRLAQLCRAGDFATAQEELYADDVVSIEPYATEQYEKDTRGKRAVAEKLKKFTASVETTHSVTVSDQIVATNAIAFALEMDVVIGGERMQMREICVYETKDGKIISERFFV